MDKISQEARSRNMQKIKSVDTGPEMTVRRLVHKAGFRYRLHNRKLPGKPDLVFASRKKVIFVHGCFWHQHAKLDCLDGRLPKSNAEYWREKLQRNVARDKKNAELLRDMGWDVLTIWECETKDEALLRDKISTFMNN